MFWSMRLNFAMSFLRDPLRVAFYQVIASLGTRSSAG